MMANGDFDLTHKKILECGKTIFKEKGFEKANLREICTQAGVTTGAFYGHFEDKEALFSELVQPVITDIEYHYSLLKQQSFTMYKKETVITKQTIESILDLKLKGAVGMVSYFFDNKDIFELLAFCSYGTKHEHFLDEIIEKLTLKGFKYETFNFDAERKISRLVSNIITSDECKVIFEKGKMLVILRKH